MPTLERKLSSRWRLQLTRAIHEFLDQAHDLSKATRAAYASDLHMLASSSVLNSITRFDAKLIDAHLAALSAEGRRPSTLARKQAVFHEFGKWGVLKGLWATNPMREVRRLPKPRTLPRPFAPAEMERIKNLELKPREAVLRALLYFTGLRVTPICGIRLGDVSFAVLTEDDGLTFPGSITTVGKGARAHVVPMHPTLKEMLLDYTLKASDLKAASLLVARQDGGQLSRKIVEKMTREWGRRAEVPNCVPHRFRHTLATDLLRQGVDIRIIQRILGHADIKSTMLYTKVSDGQAAGAILRLPGW